jgi:hypothetical protein
MLLVAPQMKILVAVEPADFRRGIDGLARLCQQHSLRASVGSTDARKSICPTCVGPTHLCTDCNGANSLPSHRHARASRRAQRAEDRHASSGFSATHLGDWDARNKPFAGIDSANPHGSLSVRCNSNRLAG